MNTIVGRVRVAVDESTVGGPMVVSTAAGLGTLAILGKLAAGIGLNTSMLLLFRFIVATVAVWSVFGVREQVRPLVGEYRCA
jgi:hypothetical protein